MDERELVIILSDIRLGTLSPNIWYRNKVHEKYLLDIFNNIIDNAAKIKEVVLLGDIFEFWSYPPNEFSPTLEEIIVVHPNILGPKGKLCQVLSALKGRMVYIRGNHDMNMTKEDLSRIKSLDGYTIKYHDSAYIPTYDTGIIFTHGHEFTLLDAPYFESKLAPLPIGYFVTRAISYKVQSALSKMQGRTITDLEEYEINTLHDIFLKFSKYDRYAESVSSQEFISRFVDSIAESTGIPKDLQIHINKSTSVSLNQVEEIYLNLYHYFYNFLKTQGFTDQTIRFNLLNGNFNNLYLPRNMKNNIFGSPTDIVIMGSTPYPRMTISNDKIEYINTDFMCHSSSNLLEEQIICGIYNSSKRYVSLMKVKDSLPVSHLVHTTTTENNITENNITPTKNVTFGWSSFNASLEFWIAIQRGILSKAKELGIEIIVHDEKSNEEEMVAGSIELISKGINALLIAPYNPELLPVIVEDAEKHQIPVIAIDIGTGGADVAAFIVSDSFGGGIFAGEYALTLIDKYSLKSTNIAIIKVQKTAKYALLRGVGFKSVLIEQGYHVVAEVTANSKESEAYEEMKKILSLYENDLAVVFCENGIMTLGAARAIGEAGKKGEIMLIGFDSGPSIIAGIVDGSIQGTIGQYPFEMGEIGVEIANSVLLGKPINFDDYTERLILMEVYLINESGEVTTTINKRTYLSNNDS